MEHSSSMTQDQHDKDALMCPCHIFWKILCSRVLNLKKIHPTLLSPVSIFHVTTIIQHYKSFVQFSDCPFAMCLLLYLAWFAGNDDIVNGNVKLILGLLWRLILHYQISSGGSTSGKQLLLIWLRNALPDLEIKNLTSDWNNGIALSGLLEFCRPGLKPDYKRLNPDEALSNVNSAMNLAEQRLRIPKILSPEFFVNPYVDELSMMTYLSQFTKPGSPGETKTMEIVNDALSERQKVSNFNEVKLYFYSQRR